MRNIILMLMLAGVSSNAMAEWVKIASIHSQESPESQTAFADPATIHKNGNLVTMWLLVDHQSGFSKGIENRLDAIFHRSKGRITKSWKVQDEFDCKDRKLRMLSYIGYAEHMGNGAIIPNNIVTGKWEPVIPESIGAALWWFACGKK
jgi:hypothetical protein